MPKIKGKVTIDDVNMLPIELSSTYFEIDEEGNIKPIGGAGGGMEEHGNEYHNPDMIPSIPASGGFKITNMYLDSKEKLVIEFEA
jgi:hypothetical protein